jgi:25S rRNA (uracil2843-N3)-methyltransferase
MVKKQATKNTQRVQKKGAHVSAPTPTTKGSISPPRKLLDQDDNSPEVKSQQQLLDVFNAAFGEVLTSKEFPVLLQEVKQALFNRDFEKAFSKEAYLDAYAARWSPTRALCYTFVLIGISDFIREICVEVNTVAQNPDGESKVPEQPKPQLELTMFSVGGGAAEMAALAAYLQWAKGLSGKAVLMDSAPWQAIVRKLALGLTTPPPISKYASEAAKAANSALITTSLITSTFTQQDVLGLDATQISQFIGTKPLLITLLFTLNELYTSGGITKTTTFLVNLAAVVPKGSLLLVVDSPGSYSEAAVGKESKKYPMQWLLDHTLLKKIGIEHLTPCRWERVLSDDSVWFRLPESLHYPIALENMRYQIHLYRAVQRIEQNGSNE